MLIPLAATEATATATTGIYEGTRAMLTNTYIKALNWTKEKAGDENGEMASWLVLSAVLAGVAFALDDELKKIMEDLADKIDPS